MLQLLPNWFYGLAQPPEWFDGRSMELQFFGLNLVPLAANVTNRSELVFSKKLDALVFGGTVIVTTVDSVSKIEPRSGATSRKLVRLSNPAANIPYIQGFDNTGAGGTTVSSIGFIPIEHLFSFWGAPGNLGGGNPAGRPIYWPIPIPIRRGGSLLIETQDIEGAARHVRYTLWTALVYPSQAEKDAARAEEAAA